MFQATICGVLSKDPFGDERYTGWSIRCDGKTASAFSRDSFESISSDYRAGTRVRVQGEPQWNTRMGCVLQLNNSAVDITDQPDSCTLIVDGKLEDDLLPQKDELGDFVKTRIKAFPNRPNSLGTWVPTAEIVTVVAVDDMVAKLAAVDADVGEGSIRFKGFLDLEAEDLGDENAYYLEIQEVCPSMQGSAEFKPRRLARRAAQNVANSPSAIDGTKPKPKGKQGSSAQRGGGGGGLDDEIPF